MTELSALPELYQIKLITPKYKPLVLRFLREYFYESEPLNSYLYRTEKESKRYLDRGVFAASYVDDGVSLMAITTSGKIIAMVLNQDVQDENKERLPETNPIFPKVKRIVSLAEKEVDLINRARNEDQKEINLKIICIHPDWRNKGIGKMLLEKTRAIAKQKGACQIISVCTSAFSAKMFANFGFQCVYALKYEEYRVNGEVVFKPFTPHTAIRAMVLKL